ncbi:M28 family metallopeptidase [Runella slithyformis]|uniref:Peptidase M28 n=1 Tax=Runella slithyformis (strain ATCC 29530 / DSM 19594 / LMG 11500 / NCIMB 11436 / LSU 4) TaxID=761193 RepID=A0A7U3ZJM9_RUNSL|nr:M28 family peptidase [Runella slithyformis]AEI48417.1 peptidase M28 [Runella slithyformis DSM 19594]
MPTDSHQLLEQLTAFPHRGAASKSNAKAAEIITKELNEAGFSVDFQSFRTPPTYLPIVYWMIGGLIFGLLTIQWLGWASVILVAFFAVNGLLYFDWRPSVFLFLPPLVTVKNIIGRYAVPNAKRTLILMAHYDSAPVSSLYSRQSKDGFRNSIRASMVLMALAVPIVGLSYHLPDNLYLLVIRILLALYFVGQAVLGTAGFWQKGYTNGASDNATGVVAALKTAEYLKTHLKNTAIEVVLTNAEEVGMVGAYHYWKSLKPSDNAPYLINFDTLGSGQLKVITQTGSMTLIEYDNIVTKAALNLLQNDRHFSEVRTGSWHTADFDSAWFVRAGIPCVTLSALDENGLMPHIHRPEDTLDHVDTQPMLLAIDLAEAVAVALDKKA